MWEGTWAAEKSTCCLVQILTNHIYIILISFTVWRGVVLTSLTPCISLCVCLWAPCAISSWHMNSTDEPGSAVCPLGEASWLIWLASSCVSQCVCICVWCLCLCAALVHVCEWEFTFIWNNRMECCQVSNPFIYKCVCCRSRTYSRGGAFPEEAEVGSLDLFDSLFITLYNSYTLYTTVEGERREKTEGKKVQLLMIWLQEEVWSDD